MPPGRTSWLARRVGLARSRQLLRRALTPHGTVGAFPLATVIALLADLVVRRTASD